MHKFPRNSCFPFPHFAIVFSSVVTKRYSLECEQKSPGIKRESPSCHQSTSSQHYLYWFMMSNDRDSFKNVIQSVNFQLVAPEPQRKWLKMRLRWKVSQSLHYITYEYVCFAPNSSQEVKSFWQICFAPLLWLLVNPVCSTAKRTSIHWQSKLTSWLAIITPRCLTSYITIALQCIIYTELQSCYPDTILLRGVLTPYYLRHWLHLANHKTPLYFSASWHMSAVLCTWHHYLLQLIRCIYKICTVSPFISLCSYSKLVQRPTGGLILLCKHFSILSKYDYSVLLFS